MAAASQRVGDSFANQRSSLDTTVRGLTQYRKEMGKVISAQEKLSKRVKMPVFDGGSMPSMPGGRGGRGGGRPRPTPMDMDGDDGYSIGKGIIAGLATNMITGIFDQIGNAVGKSINYVKGALQERIDDEMGDIQSAGGILSVGKEMKVPWADTYQEAFDIQKRLNGEMANLAAALPGDTADYVSNMKQVTDTVMKVTTSNGPAMITAMKKFNSSVTDTKGAYIEATKQLSKFTTLAGLGQTGGMPITALAEQMLNADKVSVKSLKSKFTALRSNPLVSGALEKYEAEMNKAGAGSAERYAAMLKAFEQAFPVEVLDAMTNSADGIMQGLKSGLLNPDTGLLGLGRAFEVDFAGLNRKMGPMKESLSVFDVFLGLFKSFGMVLGPIVSALPSIIEPFSTLMNPLKEFYVLAENTISNFKGATKMFGGMKLDFAPFRGSLMAIGKLAKALGADEGEFTKLEGMLTGKKLDLGAALQQAMKTLFSSEALSKFGKAIGEALGGFLSMLAGLAKSGGEMVNSGGLASGFMEGWNKSGGSEAISTIVKMIAEGLVKALLVVGWEALSTDPIGTAILATVFVTPVRSMILGWLGTVATSISTSLAAANIGGLIAGWAGPILTTITTIGTTLSGFFTSMLAALAPLALPVLAIGAIVAGIYIFRDQIMEGITFLQTWITSNFSGPIRDMLLGITKGWQGLVNMITGLVDTIWGFFSGDKARMSKGLTSIQTGFNQWLGGLKQFFVALGVGVSQAVGVAASWVDTHIVKPISNFFKWIGAALMRPINAVGSWLDSYIIKPFTTLFTAIGGALGRLVSFVTGLINTYYIQPFIRVWTAVGSAIGKVISFVAGLINTYYIQPLTRAFSAIGGLLSQAFTAVSGFVNTYIVTPITQAFMFIGSVVAQGFSALVGLVQSYIIDPIVNIFTQIRAGVSAAVSAVLGAWSSFVNALKSTFTSLASLASTAGGILRNAVLGGVQALGNAIKGAILGAASWIGNMGKPPTPGTQSQPGSTRPASPSRGGARRKWDGKGANSMPLHSAIASEMANKPAGSDLVIANSSETIIPAAGGLNGGMEGVINATYNAAQHTSSAFAAGFQIFSQKIQSGQQATVAAINKGTQMGAAQSASMMAKLSAQNASLMTKMNAVAAAAGNAGGGAGGAGGGMALGGGYGGKGSAIAGALGSYIKQTGGAPGSIHEHPQHGGVRGRHSKNSYHYQGRAIDIGAYAYEQGPVLKRIAAFNSKMGVKPVELLKAGDPGHSDHVHVAYALGAGNPAFFNSANAADQWESMMAPKSPIVSSVRARANEMQGGGGTTTVNAPITINAQPGQDADELAAIVAQKLTQAINSLRYSSYNV